MSALKNALQIFMCLMNVFQCVHYLKIYVFKKTVGLYSKMEKPPI